MLFAPLSVHRSFDAAAINAVIGHEAVRPFVGLPGSGQLDFTEFVADRRNYLLMAENGGFLLHWHEPGIYELHSQFLPQGRGRNVVSATIDMQRYMFARTDCIELLTKVPHGNVAATTLTRKMGGDLSFSYANAEHYRKSLSDWTKTAQSQLTLPVADELRAKMLGLMLEMAVFGAIDKALTFFNRWAAFSGAKPATLIAANPFVFDIGEALVALRDEKIEVILCRQP